MYSNELKTVYNRLMAGETFGKIDYWNYYENKPFRYVNFHTVLMKHPEKNLFCWSCFGSSANKATLKDLKWLFENILHTTPRDFLNTHITLTEWNRLKTAINGMIERGEKCL